MRKIRKMLQALLATVGYRLQKVYGPGIEPEFTAIHEKVKECTMTPLERQYALFNATNYLIDNRIGGAIVECGVWKGGSAMVAALALLGRSSADRQIYLYDTYAGMSAPTDKDVSHSGTVAKGRWESLQKDDVNEWDYAPLEEVRANLASTRYPETLLTFVKGKVEDTIPGTLPESIALLRLDTDWYESTYHELTHLFPRLVPGGVLILDDYGHWKGARQAVDQYFKENNVSMFLNHTDYSGRIGVKR